jgi:protein-S-isoprenylcysteine O-methyltransferase Ste14
VGKARAIAASYVGVVAYASLVFVGAWKLAYWQGMVYVLLGVVGTTISQLLVPSGSDLAASRSREAGQGQDWDKRLLGTYFLVNILTLLIAGMDSGRFGWSGRVPVAAIIAGVVVMVAGQIVFAVAKRENAFFSSTVRIQDERGHEVCQTGVYRFVRHPGYLGMLLSLLASPLVLASYWAFIPALLGAAVLVVRTVVEDRFLEAQLPGYADYQTKTRWRLVPGVI